MQTGRLVSTSCFEMPIKVNAVTLSLLALRIRDAEKQVSLLVYFTGHIYSYCLDTGAVENRSRVFRRPCLTLRRRCTTWTLTGR